MVHACLFFQCRCRKESFILVLLLDSGIEINVVSEKIMLVRVGEDHAGDPKTLAGALTARPLALVV